jgi:hypothetical protein
MLSKKPKTGSMKWRTRKSSATTSGHRTLEDGTVDALHGHVAALERERERVAIHFLEQSPTHPNATLSALQP